MAPLSHVHPPLLSRDLRATADYYRRVLSFDVPGWNYDGAGDEAALILSRGAVVMTFHRARPDVQVKPLREFAVPIVVDGRTFPLVDLSFRTGDLAALAAEFRASGAVVVETPNEHNMNQLIIEDNNGYHLGFAE